MSSDPDVIRQQIDATRAELSSDVNELGEKVSPAKIAQRQTDRLRGRAVAVKDHIMGSADDAKGAVADKLSSMGDAVSSSPNAVARKTQGSPMAAGMIAFGAGMLLSAAFPASKQEAKAAAAIKEQAQPVVDQLTAGAKEIAEDLKEPAQQAVESVKSTASDAVDTVKEEGSSEAEQVKEHAQQAADTTRDQASSSN